MKDFAKALSLGFTVIVDIFLPFGIGYEIDKYLHTFPLLAVIGLLFGVGLAFYSLYQLTK